MADLLLVLRLCNRNGNHCPSNKSISPYKKSCLIIDIVEVVGIYSSQEVWVKCKREILWKFTHTQYGAHCIQASNPVRSTRQFIYRHLISHVFYSLHTRIRLFIDTHHLSVKQTRKPSSWSRFAQRWNFTGNIMKLVILDAIQSWSVKHLIIAQYKYFNLDDNSWIVFVIYTLKIMHIRVYISFVYIILVYFKCTLSSMIHWFIQLLSKAYPLNRIKVKRVKIKIDRVLCEWFKLFYSIQTHHLHYYVFVSDR